MDDALKEIAESVGNLAPRIVRDALGYKRHSSIQLVDELCLLVLAVIEEKDVTRKAERLGDATFRDYKPALDELQLFQGHEDELGVKKAAGKECVMDGRTARDGCVEEHGDVAMAVGQIDHEAACHGRTGHRGHLVLTGRKLEGESTQEEDSRLMNTDRINELLQKGVLAVVSFHALLLRSVTARVGLKWSFLQLLNEQAMTNIFISFYFPRAEERRSDCFLLAMGDIYRTAVLRETLNRSGRRFGKFLCQKRFFLLHPDEEKQRSAVSRSCAGFFLLLFFRTKMAFVNDLRNQTQNVKL